MSYCVDCGKSDLAPTAMPWPYTAFAAERNRQDLKWGYQDHSPSKWFIILAEEIGEIAKAIYEGDASNYEEELVQSASVIVAMLENFQRNGRRLDLPNRIAAEQGGAGDREPTS